MAGTMTITQQIRLVNGTLRKDWIPASLSLTQTGKKVYEAVLSIGTVEETAGPSFGDIGNEWICVLHNLDATNYVEVGFAAADYGMKLRPASMPSQFEMKPGATLYLKANTAACNVYICVYEE